MIYDINAKEDFVPAMQGNIQLYVRKIIAVQ
jgi:hypothetical protein